MQSSKDVKLVHFIANNLKIVLCKWGGTTPYSAVFGVKIVRSPVTCLACLWAKTRYFDATTERTWLQHGEY